MSSRMVNDLFKFLDADVTLGKLQESTKKAYEGKLPDDPSKVADPEGDIQKLAEEKEKKAGEVKAAEITDKNKKSKIEKDMDKATPGVEKKSEELIPNKAVVKDEKKKEVKVSGVEKVGEAKYKDPGTGKVMDVEVVGKSGDEVEILDPAKHPAGPGSPKTKDTVKVHKSDIREEVEEGKLPDNPGVVADPVGDVQKLSEEKVLTTVSDKTVAEDMARKYPGGRVIVDNVGGKEQYIIMVQEGVDAVITTDDKQIEISSQDGTTQIVTTDVAPELDIMAEVPGEEIPIEEPLEDEIPLEDEYDMPEEEVMECAEKAFLAEHLEKQESLTEKEQAFVNVIKEAKYSEKNQAKINVQLEAIKGE